MGACGVDGLCLTEHHNGDQQFLQAYVDDVIAVVALAQHLQELVDFLDIIAKYLYMVCLFWNLHMAYVDILCY